MLGPLIFILAQGATVTFTHPCAHSSVVLKAFGEEIGRTVKPTGSVMRDYFLVRFEAMPIERAKEAIARGLNATWTESGGVLYLTRTPLQESAEEQELFEEFKKSLTEGIEEERKKEEKRQPYELRSLVEKLQAMPKDDWWESYDLEERPTERLHSRLTASLDATTLLKSQHGRVTYSSRPEGDELPLPPAWRKAYQDFVRDSAIWREAADRVFSEEDERRMWVYDENGRLDEVAKFEVEIKERSVGVAVTFVYEGGSTSYGSSEISSWAEPDDAWHEFFKSAKTPVKADAETRAAWLKENPSFDYHMGWYEWTSAVRKRREAPALLARVLADLEKNEPLTTLVSWPFVQLAESKGSNLVALLPDTLVSWPFDTALPEGMSLDELFMRAWWSLEGRFDEETGCWYAYPPDRPDTREKRVERPAFARLLRIAARKGWLGLDDVAGYRAETGAEDIVQGWEYFLSLACQLDAQGGYAAASIEAATKLYAALTPSQQRLAWEGGLELPLQNWSRGIQDVLRKHEWSEDRLTPIDEDGWDHEYRSLPLVEKVLKGRLPAGTTLRFVVSSSPRIWGKVGDGHNSFDYESIGWMIVGAERSEEPGDKITAFAEGVLEQLEVELLIPGVGKTSLWSTFFSTPFEDEFLVIEKLPERLRSVINESVRAARGGG